MDSTKYLLQVSETQATSSTPENLFDEAYYANNLGMAYDRSKPWLDLFAGFSQRIVTELRPTRTLDVGCAWGLLVEALRDRGVEAYGYDISEFAISQVAGAAEGHCQVRSATQPIEGRYDLITSIEMVEHMNAEDGRTALSHMASATDRILLSTTPFDYEESTHFNVQPPEYWAQIMADLGFYRDLDYDASYLTNWAALFVRKDPTPRDLVFGYERSEWLHRHEALSLRKELVKLEAERNALQKTSVQGMSSAESRAIATEEQLRIARDSAIGTASQVAQLEAELTTVREQLWLAQGEQRELTELDTHNVFREGNEAIEQLSAVKSSRSWKLIWGIMAPYRRLRGRS